MQTLISLKVCSVGSVATSSIKTIAMTKKKSTETCVKVPGLGQSRGMSADYKKTRGAINTFSYFVTVKTGHAETLPVRKHKVAGRTAHGYCNALIPLSV